MGKVSPFSFPATCVESYRSVYPITEISLSTGCQFCLDGKLIGGKTKNPAVLDLYHYLMARIGNYSSCHAAWETLDGIEERAAAAASLGEDEYDPIRRWEIQTLYWIITSGLTEVRFKLGADILDQLDESP